MGKKSKKKRKKEKLKKLNTPVPVLERNAELSAEKGDYKNVLRQLLLIPQPERERHLPLIKRCYKSLFDASLKERDVLKAENALNQLLKFDGEAGSFLFESIQLALIKADLNKASQLSVHYLCETDIAEISPESLSLIADILTISFGDISQIENKHPQLFSEVLLIHKSLQLVCEEAYTEALLKVKPVGYGSPVSHWRLFIKGMVSFYSNDDETARRAFSKVPDGSLVFKAAQTYSTILNHKNALPSFYKNSRHLNQICCLLQEEQLQDILPRAEYLWRSGREKDAYLHVRSKINDFPSQSPGFLHELAIFFFNFIIQIGPERGSRLFNGLSNSVGQKGLKNSFENYLFSRIDTLIYLNEPYYSPETESSSNQLVKNHYTIFGEDTYVKSQIYTALANYLAQEKNEPSSFFNDCRRKKGGQVYNCDKSEHYFKQAIDLTPGNKNIYTGLFNLYEKSGQKPKANKLLDTMISLFPDDKQTLLMAGNRCLDRKAYLKGIACLEKAKDLDRLDKSVKENLCVAYIRCGLDYAKKRAPGKFRPLLEKALANTENGHFMFNREPVYFYIRWAAFELIGGDLARAGELFEKASNAGVVPLTRIYFTVLIMKNYNVFSTYSKPFEDELQSILKKKADPQEVISLMDVLSYFTIIKPVPYWLHREMTLFLNMVKKLKNKPCDPMQTRSIVQFLMSEKERYYESAPVIEMLAKKVLQTEKEDPFFRFLMWKLKFEGIFNRPKEKELETVRSLLKEAKARNDAPLVEMIQKTLNSYDFDPLKKLPDFLPPLPGFPFDGFDEDDEDDDDFILPDFNEIFRRRKKSKTRRKKQNKIKNKDTSSPEKEKVDALQLNMFD